MSTRQIENILRSAPQPKPPGNLAQKLKAHALHVPQFASPPIEASPTPGSWLARWWPALAPTLVSLACAAGLTVQQLQIDRLKAHTIQAASSSATQEPGSPQSVASMGNPTDTPNTSGAEADELTRLREVAARLRDEVSTLEKVREENGRLRTQLSSRSAAVFSTEEVQALEDARNRAERIRCVNNLKQLGLAVRVWALDNQNMTPPNVLSMSNELGSFSIVVCPSDNGRQAAKDAASFTPANCSYEFLAPSAPDNEPDRIMFRCPIHGNIGLIDGSVQSSIAKEHPDWIVQQDGKYYFRRIEPPVQTNTPVPDSTNSSQ
jgi:hypothetical protein